MNQKIVSLALGVAVLLTVGYTTGSDPISGGGFSSLPGENSAPPPRTLVPKLS